jgi:hypothetical protein
MTTHLTATVEVSSWDEIPFDQRADLPRVTRAVVARSYAGDVEGTSTTEWLMAYAEDGSATFVGLERLTGSFGGKAGSLVLQHVGSYADGVATARLTVLDGSGSGELANSEGRGEFTADPGGSLTLDLG